MLKIILAVSLLTATSTVLDPGVATPVAAFNSKNGSAVVAGESFATFPKYNDFFPGDKIQEDKLEREKQRQVWLEVQAKIAEEERLAAEEAARIEQERIAAEEEALRLEKERLAAEAEKSLEAQMVVEVDSVETVSSSEVAPVSVYSDASTFTIETTAYSIEASVPYDGRILTATGYEVTSPYYYHETYGSIRIVAVDPNFIPLGSILNIDGIGLAIALDTGGVVRGNIVDIMFQTQAECVQYGRQNRQASIVE